MKNIKTFRVTVMNVLMMKNRQIYHANFITKGPTVFVAVPVMISGQIIGVFHRSQHKFRMHQRLLALLEICEDNPHFP
jgi:hypothetical protein